MPSWTQTTYSFLGQSATVGVSGANATLSDTAPFLRFTDSDAGHEDYRLFVNADIFKLQWLSGTSPDVWSDILATTDPAAAVATRFLQLIGRALDVTSLDSGAGILGLRFVVGAEANASFRIENRGKIEWGPGGGTAPDTALERVAAGILQATALRSTTAPSVAADLTRKDYVDTQVGLKVTKAGDTMTGALTLSGAPTVALHAATKGYVDGLLPAGGAVAKSGDTMTGTLTLDFAVSGTVIQTKIAAEANPRWRVSSAGVVEWGAGGASAVDTGLERDSADVLRIASGDQFAVRIGTEALPSLTFVGDLNTGFRSSAGDIIEIVTAGADRWQINASGHLLAVDTNTYDIGASAGTRPRNLYLAGLVEIDGNLDHDGSNIGFFGTAPTTQQASGANLTNNVTAGGTTDQIDNFTDLVVYANDAAAIRNDIYQLARKLKQVNDALRLYGMLT